jgi:hypothetical protein
MTPIILPYYLYRRMVGQSVNVELEGIWKEALAAYFEVQSPYLPGEPEKNHGNISQYSRCSSRRATALIKLLGFS